jgi:hypothetical protein
VPERTAQQVIENVYRRLLFSKKKAAGKKTQSQLDLPGLLVEELRSTHESQASSRKRRKP